MDQIVLMIKNSNEKQIVIIFSWPLSFDFVHVLKIQCSSQGHTLYKRATTFSEQIEFCIKKLNKPFGSGEQKQL